MTTQDKRFSELYCTKTAAENRQLGLINMFISASLLGKYLSKEEYREQLHNNLDVMLDAIDEQYTLVRKAGNLE